jgi:hypothetical protein
MSRSKWKLLVPGAAALLAVGCAHCDTCDDFPVSGAAGAYAGSYTPAVPTGEVVMGAPVTTAPAAVVVPPAAGVPGPFQVTPGTDAAPTLPEAAKPATPPAAASPLDTSKPAEPGTPTIEAPDELPDLPPASPPLPDETRPG